MADPTFILAALGAVLGPLSGVVTGWFLNRQTKRATDLSGAAAAAANEVAVTEAETHRFEAITSGFAEYTEKVEQDRARLEQRVASLEQSLNLLAQDFGSLIKHVDKVESLVPAGQLPVRPQMNWTKTV